MHRVLSNLLLAVDGFGVPHMWLAWTVCCLNRHCCLTAVRNRLRSHTPPTRFLTVIHCVLTLRPVVARLPATYTHSPLVWFLHILRLSLPSTDSQKKIQYWRPRCQISSVVFWVGIMADLSQTVTAVPLSAPEPPVGLDFYRRRQSSIGFWAIFWTFASVCQQKCYRLKYITFEVSVKRPFSSSSDNGKFYI